MEVRLDATGFGIRIEPEHAASREIARSERVILEGDDRALETYGDLQAGPERIVELKELHRSSSPGTMIHGFTTWPLPTAPWRRILNADRRGAVLIGECTSDIWEHAHGICPSDGHRGGFLCRSPFLRLRPAATAPMPIRALRPLLGAVAASASDQRIGSASGDRPLQRRGSAPGLEHRFREVQVQEPPRWAWCGPAPAGVGGG